VDVSFSAENCAASKKKELIIRKAVMRKNSKHTWDFV
jgi:hypothetical protein